MGDGGVSCYTVNHIVIPIIIHINSIKILYLLSLFIENYLYYYGPKGFSRHKSLKNIIFVYFGSLLGDIIIDLLVT